ncbi:Pyridoxine 5'-phosphate synthase [hydrothermal vent metagenome]|uniref:Pyridoxine 5'-phosphate synthase n=1 Tax=hydrothermal vent metagenome TaxID=652676 RepID=A0A3B1BSR4_9ZZZZ
MAKLCVNVDHVATVRQARRIDMPDPLEAALIAEKAGSAGITVHLREDRRHIQDRDVRAIKKAIKTKLNLEMATVPEIVEFALKIRPDQVTFVPERRQEITTEGGLDVTVRQRKMRKIIELFRKKGITVSLFIDPDPRQVRASADLGADAIELNTGQYSQTKTGRKLKTELNKIEKAAMLSDNLSLVTHAGHGLNLNNIRPIAVIPVIEELNIGHSIIARAIMVGLAAAVAEMRKAIILKPSRK